MLVFTLLWVGAFTSLVLALVLLSQYLRILGTDLSLNSMPKELILALVASAAQAGPVWFVLPFLHGVPPSSARAVFFFLIPALVSTLLYKLAHLADWDQYESPGLATFQFVILFVGGSFITGGVGLGVLVLTAFATALLVIGGIVKQA